MYTLQPGDETFPTYCAVVPNTAEFDVGRMQSWMPPGSSHELFVYRQAGGATCGAGPDSWIFAASIPGTIVELRMPDGVGVPLQAGTQIALSMHFINTSTTAEQPQVKLNLFGIPNLRYKAGAMVSFNAQIDVPSATTAGPGSQTVTGTCTAPAGANFFAMGTHTFGHATVADVNFYSGGTTTNIVHTTDWQNPDVGVWLTAPFFAVGAGDQFTYSCAYSNDGRSPVTVGETEANELCMTVGYYFPAGNASCQ
jgi:Copper type II ascorbate-dependent monooxygenase, C-terminal domain